MAKNNKKLEHIIFETFYDIDDWKDDFNDWCEINELDKDKEDIYDYIHEGIDIWRDDEILNLNIPIEGDVLAIADLGFWDGRKSGYQIVNKQNVNGIFNIGRNYDDVKFYCDQYNVKAELYHHDGVHYVEFREIRNNKNIQRLLDKLYNGENVSRETIRKYTKSLRPKVAKVYGW